MPSEPPTQSRLRQPVPRADAVAWIVTTSVWGFGMIAMLLLRDYAAVPVPAWVWAAWFPLCIGTGIGLWPRLRRRRQTNK